MKKLLLTLAFILTSLTAAGAWTHGSGGGGSSYSGPGDLALSGGDAITWYAIDRCYSSTYVGNVADVWDAATGSTTETLITCSTGGVVNQTIHALSVTCASACKIKTVYAQKGQTACFGSATCDMTAQGAVSAWPVLTLNYSGGKACATTAGGSELFQTALAYANYNQPYSMSAVAIRTAGTSYNSMFSLNAGNGLLWDHSANNILVFGGSTSSTASATDNVLHSFQAVFNGASSEAYIDTTATALASGGSSSIGNAVMNAMNFSGTSMTGAQCEWGFWNYAFTSSDWVKLGTNQHSSNGYTF